MIYIDEKLIEKELERDRENGFVFSYRKLSDKFLDRLFNHYYIAELCENFFDSEPEFDDEEFKMYMDYQKNCRLTGMSFWNIAINLEEIREKKEAFTYSKQPHTRQELKEAYDKVIRMYKEYEPKRITFNNWQEPYFEGNWGMSQKYVDRFGKETLKKIRNCPFSAKGRLFIAEKDDQIRIYFYGRDYLQVDYWFIFVRRKKRLR